MKEIYVPRKVPHIEVREKLHGHTKIELRDIRTGKVELIEHDNTFTDGIESFMDSLGMMDYKFLYANATQKDRAAWKTMLGGIFLFDTAIPTSPMAKYMPSGATMIANGSYGISNGGNPRNLVLIMTQKAPKALIPSALSMIGELRKATALLHRFASPHKMEGISDMGIAEQIMLRKDRPLMGNILMNIICPIQTNLQALRCFMIIKRILLCRIAVVFRKVQVPLRLNIGIGQ